MDEIYGAMQAVALAKRATKLKNLIIDEGSIVDKGANPHSKILFFKRDSRDNERNKMQNHLSPKDEVWAKMLDAVSKLVAADRSGSSREQLMAGFLKTSAGKKLYDEYQKASPERPFINKAEKPEPKTLETYAWEKLDEIAKQYQSGGMTIEAAHVRASKVDGNYRDVYSVISCAYPLSDVDFSQSVSKSKSDAIQLWKAEVDRLAQKAGI